jgi:hypothetical protein
MKSITLKTTVFLLIILIATACVTTHANQNAPGQIKKQTGAKSAKEYAPGQRKKKD